MTKSLPHFHYPDYGSVDLVLSVLEYSLCGTNLFFNLDRRRKSEECEDALVLLCTDKPEFDAD